ncbi:MAG: T9SS type A sorting domain-containing protein [FCB group bacterium]|nr:T9SS type A sorting domain-containing protein [FCB group bacterium]
MLPLIIVFTLLSGQVRADNSQRNDVILQLEQGVVTSGEQISLSLNVVNDQNIAGFQFTLRDTLDLLSVQELVPAARIDGYTLQYNLQDDGSIIAIAYNLGGGVITPGTGSVLEITFLANPVFSQTTAGLVFTDVYIGDVLAQEMPVTVEDCLVTVNPANASEFFIDDAALLLNVENAVPINLSNDVAVSGFQFHLTFQPELAHAVSIAGTDRTSGWMISYGFDNVIGFNFSGSEITPGDGPIAVLQVMGDTEGEFTLCISDIILSDPEGIQLPAASQCSNMAVILSGALGDLNQDDEINVIDVVQLVNIILNGGATPYQQWAGDINNDDIINILDVVQLVAQILGDNLVKGVPPISPKLTIDRGVLRYESDGTTAGIQLFTAGEFTITQVLLPENWQMAYNDDTILIYSLSGADLGNLPLFEYSGELEITDNIIADWNGNRQTALVNMALPDGYIVGSAYPNPFNPVTTLAYSLEKDALVQIEVYNMLGKRVAVLADDYQSAGAYQLNWNADDQPSGVYLFKLKLGPVRETRKVILLK